MSRSLVLDSRIVNELGAATCEQWRPKVSVVVPCFDEEGGVAEFHRRVSAACQGCVGSDYEIILVDDGSRDGTWAAINELAQKDPHTIAVHLARNHGHQL